MIDSSPADLDETCTELILQHSAHERLGRTPSCMISKPASAINEMDCNFQTLEAPTLGKGIPKFKSFIHENDHAYQDMSIKLTDEDEECHVLVLAVKTSKAMRHLSLLTPRACAESQYEAHHNLGGCYTVADLDRLVERRATDEDRT